MLCAVIDVNAAVLTADVASVSIHALDSYKNMMRAGVDHSMQLSLNATVRGYTKEQELMRLHVHAFNEHGQLSRQNTNHLYDAIA